MNTQEKQLTEQFNSLQSQLQQATEERDSVAKQLGSLEVRKFLENSKKISLLTKYSYRL